MSRIDKAIYCTLAVAVLIQIAILVVVVMKINGDL
jgi:cell division protein FtsL